MQHQIKLFFVAASLLIGLFTPPAQAQEEMKDKSAMESQEKGKMANHKMAGSAMGEQKKMKGKTAKKGRKGKKGDTMDSQPMNGDKMKAGTMEKKP